MIESMVNKSILRMEELTYIREDLISEIHRVEELIADTNGELDYMKSIEIYYYNFPYHKRTDWDVKYAELNNKLEDYYDELNYLNDRLYHLDSKLDRTNTNILELVDFTRYKR